MPKLPASRTKVPLVTRAMRTPILALLLLAASTRQAFAAKTVSPALERLSRAVDGGPSRQLVFATLRHSSQGPLATNLA